MEYLVRELTDNDSIKLNALYEKITQTEFPEFSQKIRDFMISGKYKEVCISLPIRLGAFYQGKLVGYLLGERHFGGVRYVWWLAVERSYQRMGIGSKLLKEFEKICLLQGAHCIVLETFLRDMDFYKKRGFELIGVNKNGYFGVDNYMMKKQIAEPDENKFLK